MLTDARHPSSPWAFLARDWIVEAFLLFVIAQIVVYAVPLFDEPTLEYVGSTPYLVPYVLLAVIAAFEGLRTLPDRTERRFWTWMGTACVVWLATLAGLSLARLKGLTLPVDLAADLAYMVFYVVIMAAIEMRPDAVDLEGRFSLERNLRWAGLAVLVLGWFSYFVVVPLAMDRRLYETTLPSTLFYITLDAIMLVRFATLGLATGRARWRLLYGALAGASVALLFSDGLDALAAAGILRFRNGQLTDLFWVVAPAAFIVTFRLSRAPLPVGAARRAAPDLLRSLDPVRVGSLLVTAAFTFPVGHYALYLVSDYSASLEWYLHAVSLVAMATLGGLAIVAYQRLERKRAGYERDRAALEDRLRQAQKLEAVGRVTGAVSHELGNALRTVFIHVDRAVDELGTAHPVAESLARAQDASRRAALFARNLLVVSRKQPTSPAALDINARLQTAEATIRETVGPRIAVAFELAPDAGTVRMGVDAFQTVLTALVMNARDAMPDGGTLVIATGQALMGPDLAFSQALRPGRYGRLLVTDTGGGIPSHVMPHLFEPFFTTKDRAGGSGLSLAMAYSLVTQHGGQISARSEAGRGAEFEVLLPAIDSGAATTEAKAPAF